MMLAAGKHHADRVDERHTRAVDDDLGRVLEIEAGDEFGDGLGGLDSRCGGGRCRLLRLRHEWPCWKSAACQSADNADEIPPPHARLPEFYNLKVSTLREPRVILPPKGEGGSRGGEAERESGGY